MPITLIAYDCAGSANAGAQLASEIMRLGNRWARPLESVWYVETQASAPQVRAVLSAFLDDDDALVVQQIEGEAALSNTMLRWSSRRIVAAAGRIPYRPAWPDALDAVGVSEQGRLPCSPSDVAAAA